MRIALTMALLWVANTVWAQAEFEVMNGLSHSYNSQPGSEHSGAIKVRNLTENEVIIKVSKKDYIFNYKGESYYEDSSDVKTNKEWIEVIATNITLPAKAEYEIPYTVKVPELDTLIGSYWSAFLIEPVGQLNDEDPEVGVGIQTVIRYAVQIINEFEERGVAELEYLNVGMDTKDSTQIINVFIGNNGDFMVRPTVGIDIYNNETGESHEFKYEGGKRIYPSTSVSYSLPIKGLVEGSYTAVLIADCGDDDVFGMNVEFEVSYQ
ncbi:MAG: hypothetical protein N4A46_01005 [Schleiferiaceae bacterium]|nr:hypothetical protein [Schleiferiaceae bacterium]